MWNKEIVCTLFVSCYKNGNLSAIFHTCRYPLIGKIHAIVYFYDTSDRSHTKSIVPEIRIRWRMSVYYI